MAELAVSLGLTAAGSAAAGTAAAGTTAAATSAATLGSWLAGTTVTTAAGVTTSLAPAASTLAALQGVATVTSMVSGLLGGAMAYRQGKDQAMFAEIDARGAELDADEKAVRIRREAVQKIASNRVAFAASGVDISNSAPGEAAIASQVDYETGLTQDAGAMSAARQRAAAAQMRGRGEAALMAAAGKALGTKLDYDISVARRG